MTVQISSTMQELFDLIDLLPTQLYPDDVIPTPVVRRWVCQLPLRHQGVLLTAIRGCDGTPKDDSSKVLSTAIRRAILNPADHRESLNAYGFFGFGAERMKKELPNFLYSLDQYPLHYITHLMHACEVLGYKYPSPKTREFFNKIYTMIVHKIHLQPELESVMDNRLTIDRIANGTSERDF
jgi:hypothetical protein